jgi:hypothetical protein
MKRLILISALLFSFNGWANDAYNDCLEMVETAKDTALEPANWKMIEQGLLRELQGLDEEARVYAANVPVRTVGSGATSIRRGIIAKEYKQKRLAEIQAKVNQLEYDMQADLEKVAKSKREAAKLYVELMKLCSDLK